MGNKSSVNFKEIHISDLQYDITNPNTKNPIKILLLGSPDVPIHKIISAFLGLSDENPNQEIAKCSESGEEILTKYVYLEKQRIPVQFAISNNIDKNDDIKLVENASSYIIFLDLSQRKSFEEAKKFYEKLEQYVDYTLPSFLVGIKQPSSKPWENAYQDIQFFQEQTSVEFLELSIENLQRDLVAIIEKIIGKIQSNNNKNSILINPIHYADYFSEEYSTPLKFNTLPEDSDLYDIFFKTIILGQPQTGKTALCNQLLRHQYQTKSNHNSYVYKGTITDAIKVQDKNMRSQVFEPLNQDHMNNELPRSFFINSSLIVICVDLTLQSEAIDCIEKYYNQTKQYLHPSSTIIIAGTKSDLDFSFEYEQKIKQYSISRKFIYLQTSAKNDFNIQELFYYGASEIFQKHKQTLNFNFSQNNSMAVSYIKENKQLSKMELVDGTQKINFLIIGEKASGRRSLLNRFIKGDFTNQMEANQQKIYKKVEVDSQHFVACLDTDHWFLDAYGLDQTLFSQQNGIILCFDTTNKGFFTILEGWVKKIQMLREKCKNVKVVMVATKTDVKTEFCYDVVNEWAKDQEIKLFQVSSKENINVELPFEYLINEIVKSWSE